MADYIDRQAAIALAKDIVVPTNKGEYRHRCIDPYDVYELQAADIEPVKHGHWEWQGDSFFKCDVCGKSTRMGFDFSGKYYPTPYCPYCGARNDGDGNA